MMAASGSPPRPHGFPAVSTNRIRSRHSARSRAASLPPTRRPRPRTSRCGGEDSVLRAGGGCSRPRRRSRRGRPRGRARLGDGARRARASRGQSGQQRTAAAAFDPWVVGASRRAAALLEPRHKARVYRPQGWLSPVARERPDGRRLEAQATGSRLLVEIELFGALPSGHARSSPARQNASQRSSIAGSSSA